MLHKNSYPTRILEIVEKGGRFTMTQMAKKLNCSTGSVSKALTQLAKKSNIIIKPIGTVLNPYAGVYKEGILTMIMESEEAYQEVKERNSKQVNGRVSSQFNLIENAWLQFPELRNEIESTIEDLQMRLLDEKKKIRKGALLITAGEQYAEPIKQRKTGNKRNSRK